MRVYLKHKELGQALRRALEEQQKTPEMAIKSTGITQGAISNLFAGRFKTKNDAVEKICKYLNINPDDFRKTAPNSDPIDQQAIDALARACGGHKQKTDAVIRVLRALEDLAPL